MFGPHALSRQRCHLRQETHHGCDKQCASSHMLSRPIPPHSSALHTPRLPPEKGLESKRQAAPSPMPVPVRANYFCASSGTLNRTTCMQSMTRPLQVPLPPVSSDTGPTNQAGSFCPYDTCTVQDTTCTTQIEFRAVDVRPHHGNDGNVTGSGLVELRASHRNKCGFQPHTCGVHSRETYLVQIFFKNLHLRRLLGISHSSKTAWSAMSPKLGTAFNSRILTGALSAPARS